MLRDLLNEEVLMEFAGERAFERGADYFADGHVVGLKAENGAITARVRGTYYYRVRLWVEDEELASECNCPVGQRRLFCKHCVAVGLAWLDRRKHNAADSRQQGKRGVTDDQIRSHLMAQEKSALVKLMMERAEWDSELRDRLVLMTAEKAGKRPGLAAFRAAMDKAIRHRSFVDYRRMPSYARGIEVVVASLGDLLKRGHANEVRELTERALKQMESAMNHVDDSDGFMGGILGELQELHLSACRAAKPEPKGLAKFLLEWEVSSEWGLFENAAKTYANVLGEKGLAEYRKLAESAWAKVPPLAPGETGPERFGRRSRITRIMVELAKQTGNVEPLVAVKSRDLSEAFGFLEIAQTYKAAGDDEAALEWAERGARAFPTSTDSRLRSFLIEEYHSRDRHDDALAVAWRAFRESPFLDAYAVLHRSARRAKQWPEWREKALALLRGEMERHEKKWPSTEWGSSAPGRSELVRIYLWEGNVEVAWNEAKAGGCDRALWFQLAEARTKDHPEDAIAVYTEQLKPALQWAQPIAYEEVAEILRKTRELMVRVGKESEFASLIRSVRARYKARRNLMKLLDAEGW